MSNQNQTTNPLDIMEKNRAMYEQSAATATVAPTAVVTSTGKTTGIDVTPVDFPSTLDCQLMTTIQLGNLINGLFRPLFRDYVGCNVHQVNITATIPNAVGPNGLVPANQPPVGNVVIPRYEAELYFQQGANTQAVEGAIANIKAVGTTDSRKKNDLMARINSINSRAIPGKNITLTDETREMLDEFFLYPYRKIITVKKQDDSGKTVHEKVSVPAYDEKLIYEVTDAGQTSPMNYGAYLKVTNLDVIALLRKIYGSKNELGHSVDYELRAIRPIQNYGMMPSNTINSLLQLSRLDCSKVDEMYKTLGMMSVVSGLPINRG